VALVPTRIMRATHRTRNSATTDDDAPWFFV
jgi:hypothetical protein